MDRLLIEGGTPLCGEVSISGAKNSVLPVLGASLMSEEPLIIQNVPHLHDVSSTMRLLGSMGATVTLGEDNSLRVDTCGVNRCYASYDIVRTMRASILVLGPLLARYGQAEVSLPGGCAIGTRPIDLHLRGLAGMGASIDVSNGYIRARAKRLQGAVLALDQITVTGTENLMMAAALAEGTTVIENAAREPEVEDLARCLVAMGACIRGAGTSRIEIEGVRELHGATHQVLPDRIEAATYLAAGCVTGGKVRVSQVRPDTMEAVLSKFGECGADIELGEDYVELDMQDRRPRASDIYTAAYPGFPTDMQAQMAAVSTVAEGTSTITETIFENRFMHIQELVRMGANIEVHGSAAVIQGVDRLSGAPVMATDLRASASLILAGLAAEGESVVDRVYHIDRGYECVEEKFRRLGANIQRLS
ncbi:MAG: UDP-N-acetylglucosamine 1-carboxyvinyltransferase [Gammaproteobacteria bacterium]|nr:UDP-N-acetylglucosamine 1-carboxyvinyltransferase [Gammaproteobacteria bacterium]